MYSSGEKGEQQWGKGKLNSEKKTWSSSSKRAIITAEVLYYALLFVFPIKMAVTG